MSAWPPAHVWLWRAARRRLAGSTRHLGYGLSSAASFWASPGDPPLPAGLAETRGSRGGLGGECRLDGSRSPLLSPRLVDPPLPPRPCPLRAGRWRCLGAERISRRQETLRTSCSSRKGGGGDGRRVLEYAPHGHAGPCQQGGSVDMVLSRAVGGNRRPMSFDILSRVKAGSPPSLRTK